MKGSLRMCALVVSGLWLAACGDDGGTECPADDPSCAGDDGVDGSSSLLGTNPTTYMEASEAGNASTAEVTGYGLESEQGLGIIGSFESGTPSADSFLFNSGRLGTVGEPGFPGVDVRVIVDGESVSDGVFLNLDTVQEFGYSALTGGSFTNAALIQGKDYVLRVTPSAELAGKSYTVEVRGHIPE